jgi:hypothetical protein
MAWGCEAMEVEGGGAGIGLVGGPRSGHAPWTVGVVTPPAGWRLAAPVRCVLSVRSGRWLLRQRGTYYLYLTGQDPPDLGSSELFFS